MKDLIENIESVTKTINFYHLKALILRLKKSKLLTSHPSEKKMKFLNPNGFEEGQLNGYGLSFLRDFYKFCIIDKFRIIIDETLKSTKDYNIFDIRQVYLPPILHESKDEEWNKLGRNVLTYMLNQPSQ